MPGSFGPNMVTSRPGSTVRETSRTTTEPRRAPDGESSRGLLEYHHLRLAEQGELGTVRLTELTAAAAQRARGDDVAAFFTDGADHAFP